MNNVDMLTDGTRFCYMHSYPGDFQVGKVDAICKAWGAVERHVVEERDVTRDQTTMMLRFDDRLWRWAAFGSMGGTPMAYCASQGYEAEDGKIAHMILTLSNHMNEYNDHKKRAEAALRRAEAVRAAITLARKGE